MIQAGVVYLVQSHGQEDQLNFLTSILLGSDPDCFVLVVHDNALDRIVVHDARRMHVIRAPDKADWGSFEIVSNMLAGLKWLQQSLDYQWVVHISGMDFPLMHPTGIAGFLASCDSDVLLKAQRMESDNLVGLEQVQARYLYRYVKLPRFPWYHRVPAWLRQGLRKARLTVSTATPWLRIKGGSRGSHVHVGLRCRSLFGPQLENYSGQYWFNMNRKAVNAVLSWLVDHPEYEPYYAKTWIPDESFLHTIVYNHPDLKVQSESYRFCNFDTSVISRSPQPIGQEQLATIADGQYFFGRKFDESARPGVLAGLQKKLGLSQLKGS